MTRRGAGAPLGLALLLGLAVPANPQTGAVPFDMSSERPAEVLPVPETPAAVDGVPGEATAIDPLQTADAPALRDADPSARRFLLPWSEMTLNGEEGTRSWSLYVTPAQAEAPAVLNLGFENALVVAPELSVLRVALNGAPVVEAPLDSSDGVKSLTVPLAAGSLRPGWNDLRFSATQRHRTDCTIQSTYELWTRVDGAQTFLDFGSNEAAKLTNVDDVRAIGADAEGTTRFNLVVPALGQTAADRPLMRLAQGLALLSDMPNQSVSLVSAPPARDGVAAARTPGILNVLVGTFAEIGHLLGTVPPGGAAGPLVTMADTAALGPSTLVVSGPTWSSVAAAAESVVGPLDRGRDVQRKVFASRPWRTPEAPMLFSAARIGFAELGVPTQEFSGRRFRTEFAVGVPADFYAQAYGEARILLDAAYDAAVEPGSHIDVYVNGAIASTLPITSPGGAILRRFPIKVPLRHFRPGLNTVAMEAVLLTDADRLCAPGATALKTDRFVLFDSSQWVMPEFARVVQKPNLASLGGTAAPYGRSPASVPLIADRGDPAKTLSAAATLLARMAVSAGRPIDVDLSVSPAAATGRNALFVAPVAGLAPEILAQVGLAENVRTAWSADGAAVDLDATGSTEETFERWRDQLRNSDWHGQVGALQEWMQRTFGVSSNSLRLGASEDTPFMPGGDASLVVAQRRSPDGTATWTVVTAPDATALRDGVEAIAHQANWTELGGRISAWNAATDHLASVPAGEVELSGAEPATLANYRLILANWLSDNVLAYSLTLSGLAVMLGLSTNLLLKNLGRRER